MGMMGKKKKPVRRTGICWARKEAFKASSPTNEGPGLKDRKKIREIRNGMFHELFFFFFWEPGGREKKEPVLRTGFFFFLWDQKKRRSKTGIG
jgi:hypothetical protein